MKKIAVIAFIFILAGCNSNGKNSSTGDSSATEKPVQNVNGNIPDTSNSGPISGSKKDSLPVDSSRVDSSRKK